MKANEINWNEKDAFIFNANPASGHYKSMMRMGRCLPATKSQAKFFITEGIQVDVLNNVDVEIVEKILNEAGFVGTYQFTKGKRWVRLVNQSDLHRAFAKKFELKY